MSDTNPADRGNTDNTLVAKRRFLIPFGLILTSFVFCITVLVVVLTWWFATTSGTTTSLSIASMLQRQLLKETVTKISFHLTTAQKLSRQQANNWRRGVYLAENRENVLPSLWSTLSHFKDLVVTQTFTTYAGELWGYYSFRPNITLSNVYEHRCWTQYGTNFTEYAVDGESGDFVQVLFNDLQTNNSAGEWVTMVNRTNPNDNRWTNLYVWQEVLWASNSVPLILGNGTAYGVTSTDLELRFISSILFSAAKSYSYSSAIYVIEMETSRVIGSSVPNLNMFHYNELGQIDRSLTLWELASNKTLSPPSSLVALNQFFNTSGHRTWPRFTVAFSDGGTFKTTLNGEDMIGVVEPIYAGQDIQWAAIMMLPQAQIVEPITNASRVTLLVAFAIIGVSTISVTMFSLLITRFLNRQVDDIKKLAMFKFDEVFKGKKTITASFVREIYHVQNAYANMIQEFVHFIKVQKEITGHNSATSSVQRSAAVRNSSAH